MKLFLKPNPHCAYVLMRAVFLLSLIMSFCANSYADGSKDLYPSGVSGGRAFLYSNNAAGNSSWPFKTIGTHYAYVKAGEVIHAASSAQSIGNGKVVLTAPNGTIYDSGTNNPLGRIAGRTNELAGPSTTGAATGDLYSTFNRVATAAQEGIWKIEFYPTGTLTSTATPDPGNVAANAAWTQGSNTELIAAWDVSVRNSANTAWEPGRVYTSVMNMHINLNQTTGYYGISYVLTKDGYVYKVNNNGNNGVGFTFFVNNHGFLNASSKEPVYKSLNTSTNISNQVHSPMLADGAGQITHKIFYTSPLLTTALPTSATGAVPGGSTWLKNAPAFPTVTDPRLKGVDGTDAFSQKGGYIEFMSNTQGRYTIEISPRAGSGITFTKRVLTGPSIAGQNRILWDGKDGSGASLVSGTYPLTVSVELQGAEVHFPFIDMEINPNGMVLELLNGPDATNERFRVYWDDSDVTRTTSTANNSEGKASNPQNASVSGQLSGPTGTGGHMWGQQNGNTSPLGSGVIGSGYGNERSMDTWTFIKGGKVTIEPTATIQVADLKISSITPSKSFLMPGDEVTVYVRAKNDGPSDAIGAGFGFKVPAGFEPVGTPVFAGNSCGMQTTATSYDAASSRFNSKLNLPNGCEVFYTITLRATAAAVQGPTSLEATILRPNDVTDPDATNISSTVPPTDPYYECANSGLATPCNNIKSTVIDFSKEPVCAEDVQGESFSVSGGVAKTFTQPGTSYGFVFDIFTLDNSFNLEINGTKLASSEIEFQHGGGGSESLRQNIRFADGSIWKASSGDNSHVGNPNVPDIWRLQGNSLNPIVRVVISPTGRINMYGSKQSGGPLFPLELFNGNTFNIINWNTTGTNTIKATQAVVSTTNMTGYGSGKNLFVCPTYTLEKEGVFNDENKDGVSQIGETITYTFTVKNLGVLDVNTVVLSDPMFGGTITATPTGDTNNNQILDKTETWKYTVTYTVTEADIINKGVYNRASLKGKNLAGTDLIPVSSVDPTPLKPGDTGYDATRPEHTFVPLKPEPKLVLEKSGTYVDANNDGAVNVGDKITYTFKVANLGNVTVKGIKVTDPLISVLGGPIDLAPTASDATTFKGEYVLTQADINKGGVFNMATAAGKDPSGGDVTTTSKDPNPLDPSDPNHPGVDSTCPDCTITPLPQSPAMTVTKIVKSTGPYTTVGDIITYDIVVTNTGNVTIKNMVLTDANAVIPVGQENIGELAPKGTKLVTVTHVITQADLDAGTVANQATVTGKDPKDHPLTPVPSDDPTTPEPADPTDVTVVRNGAIKLQKVAQSGTFENAGDIITYNFTVQNTGNVTLHNLVLEDSKIVGQLTLSKTTLLPNEIATATATYTVVQADLDAGSVINQALITGQDPANKEVRDLSGTDLTNDIKTQTPLVFNPGIALIKQASTGDYNKVGDEITYLFTVTNTGNVTLNSISLVDSKITGTILPVKNSLAPNESTTATAKYVITQADLDAGRVTNTATVTGTDPKGGTTTDKSGTNNTNDNPTESLLQQKPKIALVKKSIAGNYNKVGDVVTYTFTVTNVGNITLSNVQLNDPKLGGNITLDKTVLKPNEQALGTATYAITQADIDLGYVENQATAKGTDPSNKTTEDKSGSQNDNDTPTVTPIAQNGSMSLKKESSGTFAKAGDVITYTFTLTNTGNTTLNGVKVVDPQIKVPIVLDRTVLAPGQSAIGTAIYTVTQADLDKGQVENVATGSSTNPPVGPVPSDDPTKPGTEDPTITPGLQEGKISLVKTASTGTFSSVGDEIEYTFIIKNIGNVTLRNIILNDSKISGSINLTTATLAPGMSTTATAKYKITQTDLDEGTVINTATASGKDPNGQDVTDISGSSENNDVPTTTSLVQDGKIALVKEAAIGNFTQVGNQITYTFVVTNVGNVTLHDTKVTDSKITAPIVLAKSILAPGESTTATAKYTITQADIDAGQVRNTAKGTALDPKDKPVSDISGTQLGNDDPVITPIVQGGKLSLIKKAIAGTFNKAGDSILYEFTVTNIGNVTLNNLAITDSKIVGQISVSPIRLAPGETATARAAYAITQVDVDAGSVQNTAEATAIDPSGKKISDISGTESNNDTPTTTPIAQSGRVRLVKTAASGTFDKVGDKVMYHFVVTNVGNVTLENLVVSDSKIPGTIMLARTTLQPGEITSATAEYVITQADMDAGSITNTAKVVGEDPKGKVVEDISGSNNSNDDPTVTPLAIKGRISIIKTAGAGKYNQLGQVIPYTFRVKNTGNVTLSNVSVTDDKLVGPIILAKTTLLPGEETTGTASYTITQADLNKGTFTNQAIADGTTPSGDKVSDRSGSLFDNDLPTVTPLDQLGDMTVTKSTSGSFAKAGDMITYTFIVTNTGNITLEGLSITDPKIAGPIVLDKDILDPGDEAKAVVTYEVTQADMDAGEVFNKANASSITPPVGPIESDDPSTPEPNDPTTTTGNRVGSIALVKTAAAGSYSKVGDEIKYTFTITNTGNITLQNIRVNDSRIVGAIALDKVVLVPNESTTGTGIYKVTQADLDRGSVENTARVIGTGSDGKEVTDVSGSDIGNDTPTITTTVQNASITLIKKAANGIFGKIGDEIGYSFTVTNTGNMTLTNVNVTDPLIGTAIILNKTTLIPGESTSGRAIYVLKQNDLDIKKVVNQATAEGTPPTGPVVTDKSGTTGTDDDETVTDLIWTPIVALPDVDGPINGMEGGSTPSVLNNDLLDGRPVNPKDVILTPGASPLSNITMNPDGTITIAPGTPAGVYEYPYTICEVSNKSNCATSLAKIEVTVPVIKADNDTPPTINGKDGGKTPSVLVNDELNGKPVDPKDVTLKPGIPTDKSGQPVTGITMNPDGTITVDPNKPAGEYEFPYTICEVLNPTNCDDAKATIVIEVPLIVAYDDTPPSINGKDGGKTPSVLLNDELNGKPVDPKDITLKPGAPTDKNGQPVTGITMNPDGTVTVNPNTPAGVYTYPYTICEVLNPTNCDDAKVTIVVDAPPIIADIDTPPSINGKDGGKTPSVLDNDKLNGKPINPKDITLKPGTPTDSEGKPVTGIVMNPDGSITVAPNTPAGVFEYPYTICEVLNPTNCSSTTVKVVVSPAPIHAVDDMSKIEWTQGETVTESVLINDSYNGKPIDLTSVILTPGTPSHTGLAMNADGTITIAPGTRPGTYTYPYTICEVLNPTNCSSAVATITIEASDLFIPNTFTPNGDGINDRFEIVGIDGYDQIKLVIVNRWGNEVYRNDNYSNNWNGSGLNEGTYYYIITTKKDNVEKVLKGWVLIKTR